MGWLDTVSKGSKIASANYNALAGFLKGLQDRGKLCHVGATGVSLSQNVESEILNVTGEGRIILSYAYVNAGYGIGYKFYVDGSETPISWLSHDVYDYLRTTTAGYMNKYRNFMSLPSYASGNSRWFVNWGYMRNPIYYSTSLVAKIVMITAGGCDDARYNLFYTEDDDDLFKLTDRFETVQTQKGEQAIGAGETFTALDEDAAGRISSFQVDVDAVDATAADSVINFYYDNEVSASFSLKFSDLYNWFGAESTEGFGLEPFGIAQWDAGTKDYGIFMNFGLCNAKSYFSDHVKVTVDNGDAGNAGTVDVNLLWERQT
jgi:hypothetical protein